MSSPLPSDPRRREDVRAELARIFAQNFTAPELRTIADELRYLAGDMMAVADQALPVARPTRRSTAELDALAATVLRNAAELAELSLGPATERSPARPDGGAS